MVKQGNNIKTWKTRLFVCEGKYLYYYSTEHDKVPKGVISLIGCEVKEEPELSAIKKSSCFSLISRGSYNVAKKKKFQGRVFYFMVNSFTEMSDWMNVLMNCSKWYQGS